MSSSLKYWLLLAAVLGAGYTSFVVWRAGHPRVEPGSVAQVAAPAANSPQARDALAGPVAEFTLTDQDEEPFDSAQLKGQVWVASFFFTNCPAVCWRMNQALSAYQQTHPDSQARFVSITCDPDNDTPQALKKYAEHFKADPARWTFLTGDLDAIKKIGQDSFKISVVEKEHTDRACVVDRNGQVRGRFRLTEADQVEMLERLLAVVEAESAAEPSEPAIAAEPSAEEPVAAESAAEANTTPEQTTGEKADAAEPADTAEPTDAAPAEQAEPAASS